jgi:hypothetical protein
MTVGKSIDCVSIVLLIQACLYRNNKSGNVFSPIFITGRPFHAKCPKMQVMGPGTPTRMMRSQPIIAPSLQTLRCQVDEKKI